MSGNIVEDVTCAGLILLAGIVGYIFGTRRRPSRHDTAASNSAHRGTVDAASDLRVGSGRPSPYTHRAPYWLRG